MKRPRLARCSVQALNAVTVGLRGKAMATAVVNDRRSVDVAAMAITTNGSSFVSVSTRPSKPSSSIRRASSGMAGTSTGRSVARMPGSTLPSGRCVSTFIGLPGRE
jgi:hypothetical protein